MSKLKTTSTVFLVFLSLSIVSILNGGDKIVRGISIISGIGYILFSYLDERNKKKK